ncbi:MAG: hypothetical protein EZS28_014398 [Streblomastix strix]|uniref:TmcB/TmcC TPR repeats domain-containing protein n=1 Tax=Streblomastix strix TaxID=222440 RepID=A0A5J4W516_9EUKA|nr:MAG: hypothetical protein EZS28_014398 [Streblomastix strix]
MRKKSDAIILSEQILAQGQKKFGTDSHLWVTIALYHKSFTKNNMKLGEALRSIKQNIPSVIERWIVYALTHDMERENSQKGGSSSVGVAFRLRFDQGTKAHDLSKAYLTQAYSLLTRDNLDLERIMLFLDKAIIQERESRKVLEDLMKQYPSSVQLIRAYGALLRDIYRDDDDALAMFNVATSIEEDSAQLEGKGNGEDKQSIRSKDKQSIGGRSQSKMSNGVKSQGSNGTRKRKKKKYSSEQLNIHSVNKENLIPGFLQIVVVCMAVVIAVMIVTFILQNNNFNNCKIAVDQINCCTSIMVMFIDTYIYSKYLTLRYNIIDNPSIEDGVYFVPSLESIKKVLGVAKNQDIFDLFEGEDLSQTLTDNDVINNIANIGLDISKQYWKQDDERSQAYLYYMRANVPITAIEASKRLALQIAHNVKQSSIQSIIISAVLGILSLSIPVIVNIIQFMITVTKLKKGRQQIFLKLVKTSKYEYLLLKKRLDDIDKDSGDTEAQSIQLSGKDNALQVEENINKGIKNKKDKDDEDFDSLDDEDDKDQEEQENKEDQNQTTIGMNELGSGLYSGLIGNTNMNMNMMSEMNKTQQQQMMQLQMMQLQMKIQQQQEQQQQQQQDNENNEKEEDEEEEYDESDEEDSDTKRKKKEKKKKQKEEKNKSTESKGGKEKEENKEQIDKEKDLTNRVLQISSYIPISFYIRIFIGFALIIIMPVVFTVLSIVASLIVIQYNEAIFLSGYRSVILGTCQLCCIIIVQSQVTEILGVFPNFKVDIATNPVWNDISHFTTGKEIRVMLLEKAITFVTSLNQIVLYGSNINDDIVTGDWQIDQLNSPRTIKKGSQTQKIQYEPNEIFVNRDGDELLNHRVYSINGPYNGLEALFALFIQSAKILLETSEKAILDQNAPRPTLSLTAVQDMSSLLIYDLAV